MNDYNFKISHPITISNKMVFQIKISSADINEAIKEFCSKFFELNQKQNLIKTKGGRSNSFGIYQSKEYSLDINVTDKPIIDNIKFQIRKLGKTPKITLQKFIIDYLSEVNDIEYPKIFTSHCNFNQTEITNYLSETNNRILSNLEYFGKATSTIFSNFEAFSVCTGIENNYARKIAREYFKNKELTNVIDAHKIAMNAYKIHGEDLFNFIQLPELPFKVENVFRIFTEIDNDRKKEANPTFRVSVTVNNIVEHLQIKYYQESENVKNKNILNISNLKNGQNILKVARNGIVLQEKNTNSIISNLLLFLRIIENPTQAILNYGLQTGKCSKCGKTLTDTKSILEGKGPICHRN